MSDPASGVSADSSELLSLARRDPRSAARALATETNAVQVEVLCQLPAADRPALLQELPEPERIIPALPEGELCFTLKATGIEDSAWIVEYASDEQVVACVDLDAWSELELDLDPEALHRWFRCFTEAGDETLLRAAASLDPELCVWWLQDRLDVVQRVVQETEFEPPPGAKTLDGTYFLVAKRDKDDLSTPLRLLTLLYEARHAEYERLVLATLSESPTETIEWALRWRSGRLADLGFPPRDETFGLFSPLRGDEIDNAPSTEARKQRGSVWRLPVWVPPLPEAAAGALPLFQSAAELTQEARQAFFFALLAVANGVAVFERMPLGDPASVPRAIDKAAETANHGMMEIARRRDCPAREVLETTPLSFLFRVGNALDRDASAK